jgi:hypothetical protein
MSSADFNYLPAVRENVGLLIGLAGGTGSGKTYSALELATGLARGKRFALLDTEARRALHYADRFTFDHCDLRPPFRPARYAAAIAAADKAGYPVIVVDSASHEHAGEGGLLDWHEEILDKWCGDDWKKREASNMRAWIEPKMEHKSFVQSLLQIRAHLILCFRAEPKVEMAKEKYTDAKGNEREKTVIRPKESPVGAEGWMPVCEKNLPYEMTISFLLRAENPGVPIPIKIEAQHRPYFPAGQLIGRATGEALAGWAAGDDRRSYADLAVVVAKIKAANTLPELQEAAAGAAALSDADKGAARIAFKERQAALTAQPTAEREPGSEG